LLKNKRKKWPTDSRSQRGKISIWPKSALSNGRCDVRYQKKLRCVAQADLRCCLADGLFDVLSLAGFLRAIGISISFWPLAALRGFLADFLGTFAGSDARRPASICFKEPNDVSPRFDRAHTCLLYFAWLRLGKAVQRPTERQRSSELQCQKTPARLVDFFGLP
jgi:hypothetical protein